MIITTKLSIDMQNNVPRPVISAVQNDSNSRAIEFLFYSGCTPWTIPDGITAALSYSKPDGTAGIYDKLPDGAEAFSISGTAISAIMAPQMLTVPGEVKAAIVLSDANSTQLSTFPFIVNVVASPNPGKIVSENYCYYTNLDAINEAINALQQAGGGSSYPTTTEITEESTDKQVPTAKAVYDYVTQNSSGSDSGGYIEEHNTDPYSHADIRKRLTAANIVESASGDVIAVSNASDMELAGLRVFGKTTQNGTPTPEAPVPLESVGDGGSVTFVASGANLVDKNNLTYSASNGGTSSVVGEVITASSKSTWGQIGSKNMPAVPGATMYISCKGISGGNNSFICCCYVDENGTAANFGSQLKGAGKNVVTVPQNAVYVRVRMYINGTSGALDELVEASFDSVMLSYMDVDYEPFKEENKVTVSTPNSLPGIPVTSGGNYTDDNGQQWVCDEVDFENGKHIQRIGKIIYDGTQTWNNLSENRFYIGIANGNTTIADSICSKYQRFTTPDLSKMPDKTFYMSISASTGKRVLYVKDSSFTDRSELSASLTENPMEFLYILSEPIETALSPELLSAFIELHTNYPNTTVFNDGGAGMEVKYVADTKLYVDKKFAELSTALLNQ